MTRYQHVPYPERKLFERNLANAERTPSEVPSDLVDRFLAAVTKPENQLGDLKESWTSVGKREDLEKEYEGWDETLCKVIRCMGPNPGKWRLNDRNPVEQWTYMDGKTVLLGDAAHAMLPHQGMFLFFYFLTAPYFR